MLSLVPEIVSSVGQPRQVGSGVISVAGHVVDAITGLPFPEATITGAEASTTKIVSTRTDRDGRFVLEGLPQGSVEVVAFAADYETTVHRYELTSGRFVEGLVLQLTPSATVEGVLRGRDGNPVGGVEIEAVSTVGDVTCPPELVHS